MDVFIPTRGRKSYKEHVRICQVRGRKGSSGSQMGWDQCRAKEALSKNGVAEASLERPGRAGVGDRVAVRSKWGPKMKNKEPINIDCVETVEDDMSYGRPQRRRVPMEVVPEHDEWFKMCIVAELKELIPVTQLEKEMRKKQYHISYGSSNGREKDADPFPYTRRFGIMRNRRLQHMHLTEIFTNSKIEGRTAAEEGGQFGVRIVGLP
ncbi:hypothetical protein QQ045_012731 [Rhodiola kirilowii]